MPRILMVTPEAAPFVKTGGLADVLGSLPAALARRGEEVAVVLPRYAVADIGTAERIRSAMRLWVGPHGFLVAIDQVILHGVRYLFVDCPALYGRGVYNERGVDYPDNPIRFALLSQAAIGIARSIFRPHIFHAHDWPAGLLALFLRSGFAGDPTFFGVKCVLTIHNLGYQGNFPAHVLGDLGIDRALFHPGGLEFFGRVSFLKAGIAWSDALTTVSPTYAQEIQTPEFGFGFDALLRSRASRLIGILNGVDYDEWNPEQDPHLVARYSAADLSGKRTSKIALLEELGLPQAAERPLIGMVSRLADQKGIDLVGGIADWLAGEDLALAVLGSGETRFEDMFRRLARLRPDRVGVHIGYDNGLAHRILAGADMLLMPSRYEPSGLSQMYGLRYGTAPIVRATGGLADTVDEETGFRFRDYSPRALASAIGTALGAWRNRERWVERMRLGMAKDYSWAASAAQYQRLYSRTEWYDG
jgi:starch synthase